MHALVVLGAPRGRRGTAPRYLLRDEFSTPAAAPLTSPRPCEPGPGELAVGAAWAVAAGKAALPVDSAGRLAVGPVAAQAGLAWKHESKILAVRTEDYVFGWHTNAAPTFKPVSGQWGFYSSSQAVCIGYNGNGSGAAGYNPGGASVKWVHVLCEPYYFLAAGSRLVYVLKNPFPFGSLYASEGARAGGREVARAALAVLGAPWNAPTGVATQVKASAGAGEGITAQPDALVEASWTAAAGAVWELDVRRVDADNRWIARCDVTGGTIQLVERAAGVETERSSASQVWTPGAVYRLLVVCEGSTILTFVNETARNSYAGAALNSAAGGVRTSHAVTGLIAWPRVLAGAALAAL
jgi:hypothetical protein